MSLSDKRKMNEPRLNAEQRECTPYGEEWSLFDLLTCQHDTVVKQKLRALNISSAIDIGCRDTRLLHSFYHMLGIRKCLGVDRMSESEAVEQLNQSLKEDKEFVHDYISFYDTYVRGYDPTGEYIEARMRQEDYHEHISYVQQELDDVDLAAKQYGLVVISNVLHYLTMARCEYLINWARKSVDAGGWLYLRFKQDAQVQQSALTATDFSYEEAKKLCAKTFPTGFINREDQPSIETSKIYEGREFVWTNLPL